MLDVTYDIRARSRNDYCISIAEQSNRFGAETVSTNKYLVDVIPLREQHTSVYLDIHADKQRCYFQFDMYQHGSRALVSSV
jgi:hypothetical protein